MPEITEPGVYEIEHADYLADPVPGGSLSHSGARRLLPPSCPAKFRWWTDNPPTPTEEFNIGHAAHKLVLGAGPEIVVIDADNWRTKAAKQERDEAHETGLTPLLPAQHEQVQAMATALREHPTAGALFKPGNGWPEASLFWRDEPTGTMLRARLDWLPEEVEGRRLIVPDYKTCDSADGDSLERSLWRFGYAGQAAWYSDGVTALGLADDVAFVLVCQEKEPPHLVHVVEPDAPAMRIGRHRNREAIDTYVQCVKADHWPGYSDEVDLISLPRYIENQYLEAAL